MLHVDSLSFYYDKEKVILKDISFSLISHDILCLLGSNGTGKTTLLRCILSLNKSKSGKIELNGVDLTKINANKRAKLMSYVPQATSMVFPYEAEEVVLMGRVMHLSLGCSPTIEDKHIVNRTMDKLGIEHLKHKIFNQMSGGEKQMVLIARALAQNSRILIMDEPTANLDFSNQIKILRTVRSLADEGYSILMTSHFPDHAFLACNKVGLMRDGTIMAFGYSEDIVTTENLTTLYRTPVCVSEVTLDRANSITKVCVPVME